MSATPRELVLQTVNFERPARAPRNLWPLPWAEKYYPGAVKQIEEEFPGDVLWAPQCLLEQPKTVGDPYAIGRYVDPWGCVYENVQEGVGGQVKDPLVTDWEADVKKIRFPHEWLTVDRDEANRFCAGTDRFVFANCCPRPFERLQFLRGSANLYADLGTVPPPMEQFLREYHRFICQVEEVWVNTDVDGIFFMDDWGSQQSLLIDPAMWRAYFKPLYRDYVQIAHSTGKKCFMHSDGYILAIYPDLIELGVDAINSQIFCIGIDNVAPFAGQITFWGEIDRQHILSDGTPEDVDRAVREVHRKLWKQGGCLAQCEFGPGAKPENVRQVFATWDKVTGGAGVS